MITAGEIIKKKRESLGKNLNNVSVDTKIQKRYLEYIENNEFDKFDSSVFASGFLKIYSKYLDLDVEKILALYRRSTKLPVAKETKKKKKSKKEGIKISPKHIGIVILTIFLISIVAYVGYQIYKFQKPPTLLISQPEDEYISDKEILVIKGNTLSSTVVDINGVQTDINDIGEFEHTYKLSEGVNTIVIKAWKETNSKLQTTTTLRVMYTPSNQEQIVEESTKEFLLTVTISQSPSWVKLDIDGENKISQVLQPNTQHEYKLTDSFTLVTGRIQNTTINVNGGEINIASSSESGIGQLTCNIENNELICE